MKEEKWEVLMDEWKALMGKATGLAEGERFDEAIEVTEKAEEVIRGAIHPDFPNPALGQTYKHRGDIYNGWLCFLKEQGLLEQAESIFSDARQCYTRALAIAGENSNLTNGRMDKKIADGIMGEILETMGRAVSLVANSGRSKEADWLFTLMIEGGRRLTRLKKFVNFLDSLN